MLGEYSYTASEYEPGVILEELIALLDRKFEGSKKIDSILYSLSDRLPLS